MGNKIWRCILVAILGMTLFAGGTRVIAADGDVETTVIYTVESSSTKDSSTTDSSSTDSSSEATGTGTNKPDGNLPQAGESQSFATVVAGAALALLGTALFIFKKNRKPS